MKFKNKNILLISPEPWDHIFVSKHHYATNLAKRGNKVYFLNPPSERSECGSTDYNNVFSVHYRGFISGLRFFPSIIQKQLFRKKFNELQIQCQVQFDLVWSFDNSVFFDFSALPKNVYCISHIVDLNQDFQFAKAARTADLCIGVIDRIVDKLKIYNNKSFKIKHGVNFNESNRRNIRLPGNNEVKALYAGNLDMKHINWSVLYQTIPKFENKIDFIFIGDNHNIFSNETKREVKKLKNAYFISRVKSEELLDLLQNADILFLSYLSSYDHDCAFPHKLFEYLYTGNYVISNWIETYKDIIDEVDICISRNQIEYFNCFQHAYKKLIENSKSFNYKNSAFAQKHSYQNQITKIEKIIEEDINNNRH